MCLAIPAQVVEILPGELSRAIVDVVGVRRQIDTGLLEEPASPGDWVLVHVGFAMSRIDEAEAAATLRVLTELGEVQQELAAMAGTA